MIYRMLLAARALNELRALPEDTRRKIGYALHTLTTNLAGDVKKLEGQANAYRLRVGNFRVLFRLEADMIYVERVLDRKQAYE